MTTDQIIERCSVGLWYLASPYSHSSKDIRRTRYRQACQASALIIKEGVFIIPPIVITHPLVEFGLPAMDLAFYREYERMMIRRCDGVIVLELDGWLSSVGVGEEIAFANGIERPVVYWEREEP